MNTNIDYWNKILAHPNPIYQELFKAEAEYLAKHIKPNSQVLDLGCGDGRIINYILPITKNIIGLDISSVAIELARTKFLNHPEVKLVKGDIFSLPFPAQCFDIVTLMLTLVNLDDRKIEALHEMKRVMKDNGKLIISVYSENALAHRLDQYRRIALPVKEIMDGKVVVFDELSEAGVSEQLSVKEIKQIADKVNLNLKNIMKISTIAYIFELTTR